MSITPNVLATRYATSEMVAIFDPINKIIGIVTKSKINQWNHFREFYFLSKLRKKIISWMWKSRESKIREQFHPSHLIRFLETNNISENDGEEMDKFLIQWTK